MAFTKATERNARRLFLAATLAQRGPKRAWLSALAASRFRTLAKRLDKHNENLCNRQVSERETKAAQTARDLVVALARDFGALAHFGGDPRGPAVRLYWPDMIPKGADPDTLTDRMIVVEID
jgi:hypothetical protein